MKKFVKTVAWFTSLCLLLGGVSFASAEQADLSAYDALIPFMDLVGSAAMTADDEPEVIGNEETTLSALYISAFFNNGLAADASLGISTELFTDTAKQTAYLSQYFAAQLPDAETIVETTPISGYIGFEPITVTTLENGEVQLVGEVYWGTKPIKDMSADDYRSIQWLDRGIYTFRSDANAPNGYLLTGFSVGSELNMEVVMQTYTETILMEYINTSLGFSVLYPGVFTDDLLVEEDNGVSAALPDGSANFFVRRAENATNANLADYIGVIADGIDGAQSTLHEEFSSASVTYDTEDGNTVFDIYIVTDKYIYQAELSYKQEYASTFSMYTAYLENSFSVNAVSVG